MSVTVVVPVKDQLDQTKTLAACLASQTTPPARVICLDDGSRPSTKRWLAQSGWEHEDTDGLTIYEAWNRGFWLAGRGDVSDHVLVVNNDVVVPAHALDWMSRALDASDKHGAAYPDFNAPWSPRERDLGGAPPSVEYTRGVWGSGGMLGFCFMLARERITWRPLVQDLAYQWWYGDNHLAETIELHGLQQCRVSGLPIRHVQEATAGSYDLKAVTDRDAQLWAARRAYRQRALGPAPQRGTRRVTRRDWRGLGQPRPGA